MKNIQLILAYDGTGFLGWQKTPMGNTIEESLQIVLEKILQEKVSLQAASRTDAGVHAEGQVVNFCTTKDPLCLIKLQKSLNSLLPPSIAVLSARLMHDTFHPTLDNTGKEYAYFICNSPIQLPKNRFFSWHVPLPLHRSHLAQAIPHFLGTRDFSGLCNEYSKIDKDPVCTLESITIEDLAPSRLCIRVKGNRFLFRMVRNLVGTLAYIGLGKIAPDSIPDLIKTHRRSALGMTAPAHGLHLMRVFYTNPEDSIYDQS